MDIWIWSWGFRTGKGALWMAFCGIVLPFGLGVVVALIIFKVMRNDLHTSFGPFTVFIGVALSITAFPVLARILAERKLLTTEVYLLIKTNFYISIHLESISTYKVITRMNCYNRVRIPGYIFKSYIQKSYIIQLPCIILAKPNLWFTAPTKYIRDDSTYV